MCLLGKAFLAYGKGHGGGSGAPGLNLGCGLGYCGGLGRIAVYIGNLFPIPQLASLSRNRFKIERISAFGDSDLGRYFSPDPLREG